MVGHTQCLTKNVQLMFRVGIQIQCLYGGRKPKKTIFVGLSNLFYMQTAEF